MLARWSSWGAIPQVFDSTKPDWATEHTELRELLDDAAYRAARLTTLNAHYTGPEITTRMWEALEALGFEGGTVLEPGCGSGTFIGTAPDTARMIGVELDSTTSRIAAYLYPEADIRAESFVDTRLHGGVDAVIGNVPFGDIVLHDKLHNQGGHSIHNHFILKSLANTRPGGMVAVITSRYTMDATNPAARREMQAMADLVGAVRLPTGAHQRSAGTQAVTDILIFRRREPDRIPAPFEWELTQPVDVADSQVRINRHFVEQPEQILGRLTTQHGMYGADTLTITPDDPTHTHERLSDALQRVATTARDQNLTITPVTALEAVERTEQAARATDLWDGTIIATDDGFRTVTGGTLTDLAVPKTIHAELRTLLQLKEKAHALLSVEAVTTQDTPAIDAQRAELRDLYHTYLATYGPINRFTLRSTGRTQEVEDPLTGEPMRDPDTGEKVLEPSMARITPKAVTLLRSDPEAALVWGLEVFDETEQTAKPASLLVQRVVAPRTITQGADTPAEAVAISMDRVGKVHLELVASLLGVEPDEARTLLGDLVYDDPATGRIIPAPEYLSGDVRTRLEQAETAALEDPRYQVNVEALRQVQPDPIGVDEIQARLGSVWISPEIHRDFLRHILADPGVRVENPLPGQWKVAGKTYGILARSEWGTERKSAIDIAEAAMNQSTLVVKDTYPRPEGGTREVPNPVETTAAQAKLEAMQERFAEWVWEDPARAADLAATYNRRFNSIVLRDYSQAGQHLTTPGLAETIQLRPHQRAAVARMIAEPAVGLFHSVGAGKTLEMVVGATELKRMGMINKPCIVVPNHMLEQFSREWLQAYPQARVLAASSADLNADRRRIFIARAATNDWDAIILTQGAFKRISVSPQVQTDYMQRELDKTRAALEDGRNMGTVSTTTIKAIERTLKRAEEKLAKRLDIEHDPGINFEDMGIDYLVIDEAHHYKNLATTSKIEGAAIDGSGQAADLHMKLEWLRSQHGERVATFATATPLANSVTEAYVMQRYLRPDLLEAAGVTSFDGWAATFGQTVTQMEMAPSGGFRLKSRFAKFTNVPEMLKMWHVFADVKTQTDLNLPLPDIATRTDGRREPEVVVVPPNPELVDYIATIGQRAERIAARAVTPDVDNMLRVAGDGRKAALDMRMIDPDELPTGPVKLDAMADNIARVWRDTKDNQYLDATGEASPTPGGLQLVFLDLGTPNPDKDWTAYTELRKLLVTRGLEPSSIRFIHEAKTDRDKASMFAAARAGHVSVLIGSTSKMGVGTNVQDRIVAMHHGDCPWRPADLEQRDGRGIRQGNQNNEVAVYRYVVEGSFDSYSWQTVARKAEFIAQVMRGKLDSREIEDIGDTALSAAEVKALASGNPLLLEKANADNTLQNLRRQETGHKRAQSALIYTQRDALNRREALNTTIEQLHAADQRTISTAGDKFHMTIGDHTYTSRTDAAQSLAEWANNNEPSWYYRVGRPVAIGQLGGHTLTVTHEFQFHAGRRTSRVTLELQDVPRSASTHNIDDFTAPNLGVIRSIENKTTAIGKNVAKLETELADVQRTVDDAEARIGRPFPKAAALEAAAQAVADIDAKLAAATQPEPAAAKPTTPSTPVPDKAIIDIIGRPEQHAANTRPGHAERSPAASRFPTRTRHAEVNIDH